MRVLRADLFEKTLELSRDYETSNSPDPQDGRAEVSCPDFKRAESAEHVSEKRVGKRRAKQKSGGARQRRAQRKGERDEPEEMGEEEC